MNATKEFVGVYTALLTPFSEDGSRLEENVLRSSLDFQLSSGIHGIVVAGSIGEFTALSEDEWRRLVRTTIAHVDGRVPVIVGASAYTTAQAVKRARFAQKEGADGVMALPLGFWRLTDDEVRAHYSALANTVSVPIMIYNNPPKTAGVDIGARLLRSIVDATGIKHIKETSYDIHRTQEIILECGEAVIVHTGDDGAALPAFALGARGWVAGMSNYIPGLCTSIFVEFEKGNLKGAREAHYKVVATRTALESTGSYLGVTRAATRAVGIPVGPSRLPLLPLKSAEEETVARVIRQIGATTYEAA